MEATLACPYWVKCLLCIVAGLVLIAGFTLFMYAVIPGDTLYSVAIDSASGLDPASPTDLSLDHPEFNITLRIASDSFHRSACIDAGTYVEVSYRCVPLAASAAAPRRICVAPRKPRDETIVATGVNMRLPGHMMDSLAEDIRSGVEAFGVMLKKSSDGNVDIGSCGARRVGDETARCYGGSDTCP